MIGRVSQAFDGVFGVGATPPPPISKDGMEMGLSGSSAHPARRLVRPMVLSNARDVPGCWDRCPCPAPITPGALTLIVVSSLFYGRALFFSLDTHTDLPLTYVLCC